MSATYINKNGETAAIELSQEEKNICDYSPIEILNYYWVYPNQLYKDAILAGQNTCTYFLSKYNEAIEYYYKKYN